MKIYDTEQIRNIAFVSHGGAGKTTLTEAMLFNTGAINRMGKVEDGNTVSDYDPEEIKRQISINLAMIPVEWKNCKINVIDTPGFADFSSEVRSAVRVADGVAVLISAPDGVEVLTEVYWKLADKRNLPRVLFVNKMDRENANFDAAFAGLRETFGNKVVALQIPIGKEKDFKGIIDILKMKAYYGTEDGKMKEEEIPEEFMDIVNEQREVLIEAVAEADDELLMKYLEGEELTEEEIEKGLTIGIKNASIFPVLCGSAVNNIGIQNLMDFFVTYMPNPAEAVQENDLADKPFAGIVFKTLADPYTGKVSYLRLFQGELTNEKPLYNPNKGVEEKAGQLLIMRGKNQEPVTTLKAGDICAIPKLQQTSTGDTLCEKGSDTVLEGIEFPEPNFSVAIAPKNKGDEDKLGSGMSRILNEDPVLIMEKNVETNETILTGMGELHLDVVVSKLKERYGVQVEMSTPKVPYRETIRKSVSGVEAKYKKQTGGRGQYGHVFLDVAPLPDKEFEFHETIFGGVVPKQYIPAVEKGVVEAMKEGVLAKYPVTNIKVTLVDGSYHSVDSSEHAFKLAGSMALKKALEQADPVLLEPIMEVEVRVPEKFMGDIMGDLNSKRGRILGMDSEGEEQVVRAMVPLAEMYRYAIDLKSITQGRGNFKMKFSHYEEVPPNIAEKVIQEAASEEEEE
ncbi:MAG: elongation factor G [Clostridia bacterium]|nr:elongation factor G [Clostridia bacterium]